VKRLIGGVALVLANLVAVTGLTAAQAGPGPDAAVQVPEIPPAVAVTFDPRTTAFLVLDMNEAVCAPRPRCVATVPAVASLLNRARTAGVPVVYSSGRTPTQVLAPLAPVANEPLVMSGADKFYGTDLDEILTGLGAQTLLIVGVSANGAPMYTSFGANLRGYTVAVAEDGISSANEFDEFLARYQLLNQPGFDNPTNSPLMPGRVTLTRTDAVAFQ